MSSKLRITYNAPVVLTFAVAAVIVQLLPDSMKLWFAAWPDFHGIRSYVGLISHPLGHANWDHLLGNFAMILLIGPILEERHGSFSLLMMCLITALVTGLFNVMFMNTFLIGASGIVFMMIVLASMANIRQREIPLTFIAVAFLYLGREAVAAFKDDQVSQMAHLVGGAAGAAFGFVTAGVRAPRAVARKPGAALPQTKAVVAKPPAKASSSLK
ncbi:MAG: rhomboid family intramembrane serine protease [Myxococcales bacterium]|nr:rhomboid family intramembrane serine protease [Myxococcales bacterium]